jgi:hypothetical protein
VSFLDDIDQDMIDVFCDTAEGWGAACTLTGHDGQTFVCVACLAESAKQVRESGMLVAEGREVEGIICGLRNGDPDGDLLSAIWERDLQTDDAVTISSGPDAGTWAVVWAQPTSAHNYRVMLRLEQLHSSKMREAR